MPMMLLGKQFKELVNRYNLESLTKNRFLKFEDKRMQATR